MREIEIVCPPPKKRGPYFQKPIDFDKCVRQMNKLFADIADQRIKNNVTKDKLRPYATDIYTWRDAVNEMVVIMEGENERSYKKQG